MPTVTDDDLREMIAYALWRRLDLRPRKRSLDDARMWAGQVVEHLRLCGVILERKPPLAPHSTSHFMGPKDHQ
jgi:hypothetical protein